MRLSILAYVGMGRRACSAEARNTRKMSQQPVRHAVPHGHPRNTRTLAVRLSIRAPRLAARVRSIVLGLSPRSPVRRVLLPRAIADGYNALNREDWDVILAIYGTRAVVRLVGFEEGPLQLPDAEEMQLGPD